MSLVKAIKSGKEKRRDRRGCGGASGSSNCCAWCRGARTFSGRKITVISKLELRQFQMTGKEAG